MAYILHLQFVLWNV